MRFTVTDDVITERGGIEYPYTINIDSPYWTGRLTFMNVCKLLDLELRGALDILEKNTAVVDRDSGIVLFLEREQANNMVQILEYEREVVLMSVEDVTMEDLGSMGSEYLKRIIMQEDVTKEDIVDMLVRVVDEHKNMLEEEYRLAKEEGQ